jgi:cysteinyl-tRNA synthetase
MAIAELFDLAHILNKFADAADLEAVGKADGRAVAQFTRMMGTLKELSSALGLFQKPPAVDVVANPESLSTVMQLVIELRVAARAKKDFATADRIRDALASLDVTLEDRAAGTEWSGGRGDLLAGIMQLVIDIRAVARANKDFATADKIRDGLTAAEITLEDRAGGTDWTIQ